ncbi:MAG: hypothetical protein JW885_15230 [Deltaproteobacteria bacterium]|nr:hypothetical protein [Candidatus Zymogenaceae bacterium]
MKRTVFILFALVIAFSPVLSGCNKIIDIITGGGDAEEITAPAPPAPPTTGTTPQTPAGPGASGGTAVGPAQPGGPAVSAPTLSPDAVRASVNGKYYNLLTTISVPDDRGGYGDFYEWGYWSGTSYAGYSNIPAGYWVYVYPNWYIWGNQQ